MLPSGRCGMPSSGESNFNPAGPGFGTQSVSGSRFVEMPLMVIETCRQQGRDVFGCVTAAVQCCFAGQPCPLHLPRV